MESKHIFWTVVIVMVIVAYGMVLQARNGQDLFTAFWALVAGLIG